MAADEQARLDALEAESRRLRDLAEQQEEAERQEKERKLAEVREFEARLQRETEEALKRESELAAERKATEAKEAEEAMQRESERLDAELAIRLAHENQNVVLESAPKEPKKWEENALSKYTHSELREFMNTTQGEGEVFWRWLQISTCFRYGLFASLSSRISSSHAFLQWMEIQVSPFEACSTCNHQSNFSRIASFDPSKNCRTQATLFPRSFGNSDPLKRCCSRKGFLVLSF